MRKTQPQATNKQTNRGANKRNRTDVGTIHKCEEMTSGGRGQGLVGGVAVFLAATHLDKLNVFKNGSIFRSTQDVVDVPASSSVSLQGQLCAALLQFSAFACPYLPRLPRLATLSMSTFRHAILLQLVLAACEKWIGLFHQHVDPTIYSGHTQVAISHQCCQSMPLPRVPSPWSPLAKLTC